MIQGEVHRAATRPARAQAYLIERLSDPAAIRPLLEARRSYAAYALGQLEPDLFAASEWWVAKGSTGQALLLHARGGLGNALFALGDTMALAALLSLHPGPRQTYVTCQPEHTNVLRRYYILAHEQPMVRMAVTADRFHPVPGEARRLPGTEMRAINWLYSSDGVPSYYTSGHIDSGLYYGVYEDGRLVSIAGTHVISPANGIAVVGNVFTHPRYRGRGYATLATSAVTAALLARCQEVVLTVDPANSPAVRLYRRLGYQEECLLVEAAATRREVLGLGSALRRRLAAWRGRHYGGEFVKH